MKKRPHAVVAILVLCVGGMALSVRAASWSDQELEAALQIEFMQGHLVSMAETGKLGRQREATQAVRRAQEFVREVRARVSHQEER